MQQIGGTSSEGHPLMIAPDLDRDSNAPRDAVDGVLAAEWVVLLGAQTLWLRMDASSDEIGWTPIETPPTPPPCQARSSA